MDYVESQKSWRRYALSQLRKEGPDKYEILLEAYLTFPWAPYEDIEFFQEELEDLVPGLPPNRYKNIEKVEDFTPSELLQWQAAAARVQANSGDTSIVWIVKLTRPRSGVKWALFRGHTGCAPEDEPGLVGIFDTAEDAVALLDTRGQRADG